jgi:hypothetical protein
MSGSQDLANLHFLCPFCSKPLNAKEYIHPGNWTCPICHTPDSEWNPLLCCANCGYGHRLIECVHCKEDFDSMRSMGDFETGHMDFMSIGKYSGPRASYRVGDLRTAFRNKMDKDTEQALAGLLSDAEFSFPGASGQIRVVEIYNVRTDQTKKGRLWICAYLYDRTDIKPNTDVGQLVFLGDPGEGITVHTVVDVNRGFIFKDEKRNRKVFSLDMNKALWRDESSFNKYFHTLLAFNKTVADGNMNPKLFLEYANRLDDIMQEYEGKVGPIDDPIFLWSFAMANALFLLAGKQYDEMGETRIAYVMNGYKEGLYKHIEYPSYPKMYIEKAFEHIAYFGTDRDREWINANRSQFVPIACEEDMT